MKYCINIYIHTYSHIYIYIYTCIYIYTHTYVHIYIYINMYRWWFQNILKMTSIYIYMGDGWLLVPDSHSSHRAGRWFSTFCSDVTQPSGLGLGSMEMGQWTESWHDFTCQYIPDAFPVFNECQTKIIQMVGRYFWIFILVIDPAWRWVRPLGSNAITVMPSCSFSLGSSNKKVCRNWCYIYFVIYIHTYVYICIYNVYIYILICMYVFFLKFESSFWQHANQQADSVLEHHRWTQHFGAWQRGNVLDLHFRRVQTPGCKLRRWNAHLGVSEMGYPDIRQITITGIYM